MLLENVFVLESCCVAALWRVGLGLKVSWANMMGDLIMCSLIHDFCFFIKDAVYTVRMFLELYLFAKKMRFLTKGGILL